MKRICARIRSKSIFFFFVLTCRRARRRILAPTMSRDDHHRILSHVHQSYCGRSYHVNYLPVLNQPFSVANLCFAQGRRVDDEHKPTSEPNVTPPPFSPLTVLIPLGIGGLGVFFGGAAYGFRRGMVQSEQIQIESVHLPPSPAPEEPPISWEAYVHSLPIHDSCARCLCLCFCLPSCFAFVCISHGALSV